MACMYITVLMSVFLRLILAHSDHYWVYPFLNWEDALVAVYYFMVAIICVVAFFVQFLIHWIRDFIARKTGHDNFNEKVGSEKVTSEKFDTESIDVEAA